jgi:hypothetical protein
LPNYEEGSYGHDEKLPARYFYVKKNFQRDNLALQVFFFFISPPLGGVFFSHGI